MSKKLLYVDDNIDMLDLITRLLEEAGYTAATAQNVDEALRMSKGTVFDVMVFDVSIAGESGVMLADFMLHHQKGVPVILYSAGEREQANVGKLLALRASQFVQKCNGLELVAAVQQLCPLGG
jgi:DNA-binding NtrC family response regulator